MLRDERGCTAQSSRAYHCWTQTLTCAMGPLRLKGHDHGTGRMGKSWHSGRVPGFIPRLWGQPLQRGGSQRNIVLPKSFCMKNSFLTWGLGARRILGQVPRLGHLQVADQIRALGSSGYANGTRRHPPSTRARSRHRDERTAATTPNSTHADDSRAASSASVCSKCRLMRCVNSTFVELLPFAFCALRALYGLLRG
jgi:hypothetical protein